MPALASIAWAKTGVRMNATDVTGPCATVQYGLIMLTRGSRKTEFRHDGKPIQQNTELRMVRFSYWKTKTEPSDGCPQTPNVNFPFSPIDNT